MPKGTEQSVPFCFTPPAPTAIPPKAAHPTVTINNYWSGVTTPETASLAVASYWLCNSQSDATHNSILRQAQAK